MKETKHNEQLNMKHVLKSLAQIVGFLAGLILTLGLLSILLRHISLQDDMYVQNRNESEVNIMKEAPDTIDVIMLGDSLIYTAISPLQIYNDTGITAFDLCESQQQIQESCAIMETAFKTQHPKVVILSASTLFLDERGKNDFDIWMMESLYKVFPIVQYHDMWKPLLAKSYWIEEETYKGYIFRDVVYPYTEGAYMKAKTPKGFKGWLVKRDKKEPTLDPIAQDNLLYLQELCEANGAELILIATPSPADWNSYRNYATYTFAKEHDMKFYDLNLLAEQVGIDWQQDSFDGGEHLNLLGAQKVTRYVENIITEVAIDSATTANQSSATAVNKADADGTSTDEKTRIIFTDHRGQAGFERWDQEAESYRQKENEVRETIRANFGI